MPFYERGQVRIHYEEVGSGFPLLVIPGGGLNSTVAGLATHPFNPFDEFKGEFRVIAADLRNAKGIHSSKSPAGTALATKRMSDAAEYAENLGYSPGAEDPRDGATAAAHTW
jgi:pimeloyl-ACP methyl ester carboxylesterase